MSKSLCFSKEEISLLCASYHITDLVCFKNGEETVRNDETVIERYHRTVFELYKKEYLKAAENGFIVSKEVKAIFSVLKTCNKVMTTSCKDENVPGYCLYFSESPDIVLMREGDRKDEYVKAELLSKEEFFEFIKSSGTLPEETIWEEFAGYPAKQEMIGIQMKDFLQKGSLCNGEKLWEIPEVISLFRIQQPQTAFVMCYVALVKQPIWDRILMMDAEGIEIFTYSEKTVQDLFLRIWEEKDDISGCVCSKCE